MSTARTAAASAVAAVFRVRAETVSIPIDTVPTEFSAIRADPAEPAEFGPVRVVAGAVTLRFMADDIAPAAVLSGDLSASPLAPETQITLADASIVAVKGAPQWGDPLRVTIEIDTQPAN